MPDSAHRLDAELHRVFDDMRPLVDELAPSAPTEAPPAPEPSMGAPSTLPRPWSFDAAMQPLPEAPSPPRRATPAPAPHREFHTYPERRHWPVLAAAAVALVALVVFGLATAKWIHLATAPAGPSPKPAKPVAALLVPVTGPAAAGTPASAPTTRFPDGTTTVYVAVRMAHAVPSPVLTFSVALQADSTAPRTHFVARTFVLAAGSAAVVPIAAPSGDFDPGTYTVTAAMNGAAVGTTNFVIG